MQKEAKLESNPFIENNEVHPTKRIDLSSLLKGVQVGINSAPSRNMLSSSITTMYCGKDFEKLAKVNVRGSVSKQKYLCKKHMYWAI